MKYICLGYIEPGKFEGMTEDERHAVLDECFEHNDHLRANGHLVAEVTAKSRQPTAPMRKPRNSSAAFRSLRRETSITPFSLSQSNQALSMDLDRLRYGRLRT